MAQPASRAVGSGIESDDQAGQAHPADRVEHPGVAGAVDAGSAVGPDGTPWLVYICNACGLLYDEREGDADSGLAPGTRFADIPEDWACPLCGVRKDDFVLFQKVDAAALRRAAALDTGTANAAGASHRTATSRSIRAHRAGVVIVGAGRAGWQVAQALRQRDADLAITLVTGCNGDLYDKPMLSVAHAKAISLEGLVRERGVDAAARLKLHLMPHTFATGLSPQAHRLRTTSGSLRYRHLVIAAGARARSVDVLPATLCWRINHLDAYLRLRQHLAATGGVPRHVVIVGAGLVGCELANDLALAGHRITLIEAGASPLSAWLPAPAASALLNAWKDLPINFMGNASVAGLAADGARRTVTTVDGLTIVADEVISATGLEVERLLADSGALAWNHGIAVDAATLATSAPDVFALGDCITIDGMASRYIEPIGRQAQAIAGVITGIDAAPYVPRASPLRVKTSSCTLQLDGLPDPGGTWRIDADPDAAQGADRQLRMSQWIGDTLQARLKVG